MTLDNLKKIFARHGCNKIYIKYLSPNDNSKNQVYLSGSFDILNILPISSIKTEEAGDWKKERFKASLNYYWIGEDGKLYHAPKTQLILYPKYPEVRFSGFLVKCEKPPSELMSQRLVNRLLFIGVTDDRKTIGYVASPDSILSNEFNNQKGISTHGIFKVIELPAAINNRSKLITELYRIHKLDWIKSKRLGLDGRFIPCLSSNCGGYTLEAELGITPNGYSEPDYLGWEVKQFGVKNLDKINSTIITLMTPEPTDGIYKSEGVENFIRKYGYFDKKGRADRMNFGGIHKVGVKHPTTNLELQLVGFDTESGKIRNSNGYISLIDNKMNEVAVWSFSSLLLHWNRKHNQACYVPSLSKTSPERSYKYGKNILLGTGTDFQLFLQQMSNGLIYYDPGIKLENISTKPQTKRRSQFRIKSGNLSKLYYQNEIIDITKT